MTNLKALYLLLLYFTVVVTAYGQTNKLEIGVEGSPSLIFLYGNEFIANNHKPSIGFTGGVFFQFNFKKTFSLRTNIAFERKGNALNADDITNEFGDPLGKIKLNTHLNYLTLPILARATFGKKIQFFINAGPYFGYLINESVVFKGKNILTTNSNTSLYKRFDTGIATGLGLSIPIKSKFAISFETRNNLGLYNISALPIVNNETIKTNSTNFLFGFTYKFGQQTSDLK